MAMKLFKTVEQYDNDEDEEYLLEPKSLSHRARKTVRYSVGYWILGLLLGASLLLNLTLYGRRGRPQDSSASPTKLTDTIFRWHTRYSGPDEAALQAADEAWNRIVPAHGVVAVDKSWAASQGLPESMALPGDASKGVYIVDAYHQIHCLTIMRRTMRELQRGHPLSFPAEHAMHCADSLLQYVTCTAGDTLLYTWGRNETGSGQARSCRSWSELGGWAAENSACYKDTVEPVALDEHFGDRRSGDCESAAGDGIEL